ncbi:MAG: ABC transporter permease subunit, partial [Erysipelotrichaceae bacterium]|nr:ABC transporter permease subunit [Erysipelotrichaceae bacterium]
MSIFEQLISDISKIWATFGGSYLYGIKQTLLLALIGTVLGCLIGFICGILQTIPVYPKDGPVKKALLALLRGVIRVYVEVFRGTPMVLQAVFIYYGLPYFTNGAVLFDSVWACAILVVSINTGAYMAETVRGGILSIDRGQTEGAKAIGMSHVQTM